MTKWKDLYGSEYLRAEDLSEKGSTATIVAVEQDVMESDDDAGNPQAKKSAVVTFKETKTRWAVNVINRTCLEAMFGEEIESAIGKRVTLHSDLCEVKGKYFGKPAIRVLGSPDITAPITVVIRLKGKDGRERKPFPRKLVPTGGQGGMDARAGSTGEGGSQEGVKGSAE